MEFTKRDFKKPELTDPADIRDLNENSDSLEEHLNAITGYDYGKTIVLGTDAVEINKIHLNKIPADPDFGKYFLILTGSTWDTSTKEEYDMKTNPSLEDKLPKGTGLSPKYDTAKKIEDKIENINEEVVLFDGTKTDLGIITLNGNWSDYKKILVVSYSTVGNMEHREFFTEYIVPNDSTIQDQYGECTFQVLAATVFCGGYFRDTNRNEMYISENQNVTVSKVVGLSSK